MIKYFIFVYFTLKAFFLDGNAVLTERDMFNDMTFDNGLTGTFAVFLMNLI